MAENGSKTIKRQISAQNFSKQPRFSGNGDESGLFSELYRIYRGSEDVEPEYEANSAKRDTYLRDHVAKNPNIGGVLNAVVAIDKNRGWRLVGGRNQVSRFTDMFHGFEVAPGMVGWRPGISFASKSFWSANMGFVVELGREGENGPLRKLYNVDPTKCVLRGDTKYPLEYKKGRGKSTKYWRFSDFFRGASDISTDEDMNGLGRCALDRALILSKLMIALYDHDFEAMGSRAPRGLLLLQGISEQSWNKAMAARDAKLDAVGYEYYGALGVLASAAKSIDAKLLALSELPKGFNMREFMDMLMYGFALCFGYDPSEFWPVQFGALGRGTEMEVQHEKATGKGRLDFVLSFQEQLQEFLPDTLEFMFDQRDEKGDLLHASVNQAWANLVKTMTDSSLLSLEEGRVLLADYGVIPKSWATDPTASQTDLDEKDTRQPVEEGDMDKLEREPTPPQPDDMRARVVTPRLKLLQDELKEGVHVWRCATKLPAEPIVQYSFPGNTLITLWDRADEILRKSVWTGASV